MKVNVRYFSPSDMRIIYVKDGNWILLDEDGNERPTSEYYPNSQHWNGNSPFFPVDYWAEPNTLFDDDQAIHWMLFHYSRIFADGISTKRDYPNEEWGNDLQRIALKNIKTIVDVLVKVRGIEVEDSSHI